MTPDHRDHHGHSHVHAPTDFGAMFALSTALNVALVVVELFYGFAANSVALLADAGHNFSDALGLVIAWVAHVLAKRHPTSRYTYGFRPMSILAALLNGVILLIATGAIALETVRRLLEPSEVGGTTVMVVAALGIAINGLSAWLLMKGQKGDLNVRGAFLHMIGDAAVSIGVVVAGGLIAWTGWLWIDPATSLLVSAVIVWSTWGLLREAANLSLGAVPEGIDPERVRQYLGGLPGVEAIHDLHVWAMSTTEIALTCHIVMPNGHPGDALLQGIAHELHHRFGIAHPTVQIELSDAGACKLAPDHIV